MSNINDIGVRNGDIWMSKRLNGEGSMMTGAHIVIIIGNLIGCINSPNVTVIPITSKNKSQPTHVEIPANNETGLVHLSISQAESVSTLSKKMLSYRMGYLNDRLLELVQHSLLLHTGIIDILDKSYINQLCTQISGDINFLEKEITTDISIKLARNSMRVSMSSLQKYCSMYVVNWKSMLLSNLKQNGIKYSLEEIEEMFNIEGTKE